MPSRNGRYGSLKRLWEAGSREVQRGLRVLLEGPPEPGAVTAPEELGPNNAERELDLALLQIKATTCRNISDALDRVARGTFGLCAACGERIPTARLRALPFALRCRGCQEREEGVQIGLRLADLVPTPLT
jgi:RNA polymerase-binding transcription factor DksA